MFFPPGGCYCGITILSVNLATTLRYFFQLAHMTKRPVWLMKTIPMTLLVHELVIEVEVMEQEVL